MMEIFHKLDLKFDGKLRRYSTEKILAKLRGEDIVFSEGVAYIDALFDLEIFDHLHKPNLIGIERKLSTGEDTYIIFEVIGVRPMHYEMPSLTPEVPPVLKWEYLKNINESWIVGGENWMEIVAIHSGYLMKFLDGALSFEKTTLSPLVGSKAHILSKDVIREMVCIDPSEKYVDEIGELIGYEIPLRIDIYNLFRYHTGIFGFTGSGKSNLASLLIRKVLNKIENLKVFIFDLSGEYTVNLLDVMVENGYPVYTDEPISLERFIESQVIPESLLENLNKDYTENAEEKIRKIMKKVYLRKIALRRRSLTVGDFKAFIKTTLDDSRPHLYNPAYKIIEDLDEYSDNVDLIILINNNEDIKAKIINYLEIVKNSVSSKSNLFKAVDALENLLNSYRNIEKTKGLNIYDIANEAVNSKDYPKISIFYIPDPRSARRAVYTFINELFRIKKYHGVGNKILIVLDEAQEFIPDKTSREDYTYYSNLAVEMLLRQGRKYLIGGWIATQRLAHLNTNALQQLHSYFVSTLPRSYDRNVVSDAFSISRSVIDKVTELETGEWIFVSYKATRLKNVPVEIKAYNNEDFLFNYISYNYLK